MVPLVKSFMTPFADIDDVISQCSVLITGLSSQLFFFTFLPKLHPMQSLPSSSPMNLVTSLRLETHDLFSSDTFQKEIAKILKMQIAFMISFKKMNIGCFVLCKMMSSGYVDIWTLSKHENRNFSLPVLPPYPLLSFSL